MADTIIIALLTVAAARAAANDILYPGVNERR
jgi:hypothetical protein